MAGPPVLKPARVQTVPPPINSPEGRARLEERAAAEAAARQQLPKWRRFFRASVPWLFLIFLGGVVMQIALAGAALLGDDSYWIESTYVGGEATSYSREFLGGHATFVHILELFAVLVVVAGFLGADKEAGGVGIALFVLISVQYFLVGLQGVARSFHVLNALVIFTLTLLMTLSRIPWRPKLFDHVVD